MLLITSRPKAAASGICVSKQRWETRLYQTEISISLFKYSIMPSISAITLCLSLSLWFPFSVGEAFAQPSHQQKTKRSIAQSFTIPRVETGAEAFLKRHPQYDGRGIVIAIFDSGVDPGAASLQTTSDGKPKIIDLLDGTGSGDVNTTVIQSAEKNQLKGLTGRVLTINPQWSKNSNSFHLGMKWGYDLFSSAVTKRLQQERKKKWEDQYHQYLREARQNLRRWNTQHPKALPLEKRAAEELETRIDQLKKAWKEFEDPGPVYDCVTFHDGSRWRAVIDTDEDGDLTDEKVLTNFRQERQYATFGNEMLVNFSVNIYDEGKLLSIVTNSSSHGTHVAGIVAAHNSRLPERNGIAPGAQIVSVKIGDTRLDSMETGAGLLRGFEAVKANKCHLINMSYGEPSFSPNQGRLIQLFDQLIQEENVVFVASAGNAGPALFTVGSPGGTTSSILGIGAYLSPSMMSTQYALPVGALPVANLQSEPILQAKQQAHSAMSLFSHSVPSNGIPYTWTSRGPTTDGDLGVDLFAPGGAIAPVPLATLAGYRQAHGTSMASPNACGNIALLLSAMKAEGKLYSPSSLKSVLTHTAKKLSQVDPFAQGPGLIQIDKAWKWYQQNEVKSASLVRLNVSLPKQNHARGVVLFDTAEESSFPQRVQVRVRPGFAENWTPEQRANWELNLTLKSSEKWIQVANTLFLTGRGAEFPIDLVSPWKSGTAREYRSPGSPVKTGFITAFRSQATDATPIFRVPVTIIQSENPKKTETSSRNVTLHPGAVSRFFWNPPPHASWLQVDITRAVQTPHRNEQSENISEHGLKTPLKYVTHKVQLEEGKSFRENQHREYLSLLPGEQISKRYRINSTESVQFCVGQLWNQLGSSNLTITCRFGGFQGESKSLHLNSHRRSTSFLLTPHKTTTLSPSASFTKYRRSYDPEKSTIQEVSSERGRSLMGKPVMELKNEYSFELLQSCKVLIRFPQNEQLLYDSTWGTELWFLYDHNGKLVHTDDVYPTSISLKKGRYRLQYTMRHTELASLKKLSKQSMLIDIPMDNSLVVPIYETRRALLDSATVLQAKSCSSGKPVTLWLETPELKLTSNGYRNGDLLLGSLELLDKAAEGRSSSSHSGTSMSSSSIPLYLQVNRNSSPTTSEEAKQKPADKGSIHQFLDVLLKDDSVSVPKTPEEWKSNLRVHRLKQLIELSEESQDELFEEQFKLLHQEYREAKQNPLPLLLVKLHRLDSVKRRKDHLLLVIRACNDVLRRINVKSIRQQLGTRPNLEDVESRQNFNKAQHLKSILIDTLYRKGRAIGYQELPDVLAKHPVKNPEAVQQDFESNFNELRNWVDPSSKEYFLLYVRRERRLKRPGSALMILNKHFDSRSYWHVKKKGDLFEELGWNVFAKEQRKWLLRSFPLQNKTE